MKSISLKSIIFYSIGSLFVLSPIWNISYSYITFVATNLSVRESFYFKNDINKKGTHSGGETYIMITKKHKYDLVQFNFTKIFNSFLNVSKYKINNSNFSREIKLISLLDELGKQKIKNKNKLEFMCLNHSIFIGIYLATTTCHHLLHQQSLIWL